MRSLTPSDTEASEARAGEWPQSGEVWHSAETGEKIQIVSGVESIADNGYVIVADLETGKERLVQPCSVGG